MEMPNAKPCVPNFSSGPTSKRPGWNVGLLADAFLVRQKNARIIHDPRLTWNTIDIVEKAGGQAVMSKTGHAFIKERMRAEDAVYGGEMSAHHFFRDFAFSDSGMIPWLFRYLTSVRIHADF